MSRLDLVVGPNGAGKSTFVAANLRPLLPPGTPFVNADEIAKARFPGEELHRSHEAAAVAERTRDALIARRIPLIAETVFSHESKLALVDRALAAGYYVHLHVLAVPVHLAVARVAYRVRDNGHDVPEDKIVSRWHRLWPLVADAVRRVNRAQIWDNSQQHDIRKIADFFTGLSVSPPDWPDWAPQALRDLAPP